MGEICLHPSRCPINCICQIRCIGFSREFVPIMFQKNEKKNCKKTIWLSYFLKVNMSLFNDQLKLLTPLFSLCYIWCTILNIYFCSLLHDVYYVICYILKWKKCRWYTWRQYVHFFLHTGSWHIRNFSDKIFCYFGLDFFRDDHLKNGPLCVLSLKFVSLQKLLQCTCFQNLEWITYPTTGSNFASFTYIGSFL